jgi:anti-anti-sigma regulatory factor
MSSNESILVVTFAGAMAPSSVQTLQRCREELAVAKLPEFVILYFRDVPTVSIDAVQILAQMQRDIRLKCPLSICSLRPETRDKLLAMGILRQNEMSNNLQDALQRLALHRKLKKVS